MTQHPGTIIFEDADVGTVKERAAADVPDNIAWILVAGLRVPVTRVVARLRGDQREIQSFGPDGALLNSTIQIRR